MSSRRCFRNTALFLPSQWQHASLRLILSFALSSLVGSSHCLWLDDPHIHSLWQEESSRSNTFPESYATSWLLSPPQTMGWHIHSYRSLSILRSKNPKKWLSANGSSLDGCVCNLLSRGTPLTASCGFINVLPFFADQVILGVVLGAFLGTFTTFFPFTLL